MAGIYLDGIHTNIPKTEIHQKTGGGVEEQIKCTFSNIDDLKMLKLSNIFYGSTKLTKEEMKRKKI